MFTQARLKLTAWYLLILTSVSFLFSVVIYRVATRELEQGFHRAELRLRARELGLPLPPASALRIFLIEDIEEAKQRVLNWLLITNGAIIGFSAFASYALAGKTLAPIKEALENQKRFFADASHELRTPLTALKTSIEVALRDKKSSKKTIEDVLKSNLDEVNELAALNENLLSLARFENNGSSPSLSRIDLSEVGHDVIQKLAPLAKKKQITLSEKFEPVVIMADEQYIKKLLTLLLDNAIKYTPNKGTVDVTIVRNERNIVIKVKDSGVGIAKKDVVHIFDRFYRADVSRSKVSSTGFGLGLSIAKKIVQMHRGKIAVVSTEGKGSQFTITLPLSS